MKKKMYRSLCGIAIVAILLTSVGVSIIYHHLFVHQVEKELRIWAQTIAGTGLLESEEKHSVLQKQEFRVTWIASDGEVLYDNRGAIGETDIYDYALQLADGTVLRVSANSNIGINILINALPFIMLIVLVVVCLCFFLARRISKKLMRPIIALGGTIEAAPTGAGQEAAYKELIPFLQTIRAQHENILAAAKMRQDFTANVSHELKTPLTAIQGYAELIENRMVTKEQEVTFAAEIRKNSDRLLTLINDIIRLSELDGTKEGDNFETLDLYELAVECSQNYKINAQRAGVTFELAGESAIMHGNRHMLMELMDNLCANAIRYNNEGGTVLLSVSSKEGRVCMTVADTGIGISKEHKERVFERFYRVDKSRSKETGGTGLGLAIVKHIVAIHGADIRMDSEVGIGTKITILF